VTYRFRHDAARRSDAGAQAQAAALLGGMAAVLAVCAWFLAGVDGLVMAAAVVLVVGLTVPQVPPATVMRLFGAVPIEPWRLPEVTRTVALLARRAGLAAPPALYWVPDRRMNAFAVGNRRQSAIGLSNATLRALGPRELSAVLAHEVSHIAAGDTGLMRVALGIGQITRLTSFFGVTASLLLVLASGGGVVPVHVVLVFAAAPTAVTLLQLAFSRNREFAADLGAAQLTGDPLALVSALETIEASRRGSWPWRLGGPADVVVPSWLLTHPPVRLRVERLMAHVEARPSLHGTPWDAPVGALRGPDRRGPAAPVRDGWPPSPWGPRPGWPGSPHTRAML